MGRENRLHDRLVYQKKIQKDPSLNREKNYLGSIFTLSIRIYEFIFMEGLNNNSENSSCTFEINSNNDNPRDIAG